MKDDPVVEEIHRYRRELMQEHGNSLHVLCQSLRQKEKQMPQKVINLAPSHQLNVVLNR